MQPLHPSASVDSLNRAAAWRRPPSTSWRNSGSPSSRSNYLSRKAACKLERAFASPRVRHSARLRAVEFRGLGFAVPEFSRLISSKSAIRGEPPPARGAHKAALLESAGVDQAEYKHLIKLAAPTRLHSMLSPGATLQRLRWREICD